MNKYYSLILTDDGKRIEEVNGKKLKENFFYYKDDDKKLYYLMDNLTGLSLHSFKKLKELKSDLEFYINKYNDLLERNGEFYNKCIKEFNNLIEKGDSNE